MKTNIIKAALFTPYAINPDTGKPKRWGLPLLLWGLPGIAKSAIVNYIAEQFAFNMKTLTPGKDGEGAFGVTPMPQDTKWGPRITFPRPDWVDELFIGKEGNDLGGIVFPDETNTAPPALQPAIMAMIQDRCIGSYYFGPRVRVLGAANPVNVSAGGWDLAPPVANRLGHIDWDKPSVDEWTDWLIGGANGYTGAPTDALAEEARVLKAWPNAFAKAAGMASAFLRRKPDLHFKMPAEGDPQLSRAWCSPRSWENAVLALASGDVHDLTELETDELFRAFIGNGAATEFAAWRAAMDLPDPSDVLDGKVKFKHDAARLDRTFAVLQACTTLVAPQAAEKRKERAAALWKILTDVCVTAGDITVPSVRVLCDKKVWLAAMPEARPVLIKLQPMLAAAGITAQAS